MSLPKDAPIGDNPRALALIVALHTLDSGDPNWITSTLDMAEVAEGLTEDDVAEYRAEARHAFEAMDWKTAWGFPFIRILAGPWSYDENRDVFVAGGVEGMLEGGLDPDSMPWWPVIIAQPGPDDHFGRIAALLMERHGMCLVLSKEEEASYIGGGDHAYWRLKNDWNATKADRAIIARKRPDLSMSREIVRRLIEQAHAGYAAKLERLPFDYGARLSFETREPIRPSSPKPTILSRLALWAKNFPRSMRPSVRYAASAETATVSRGEGYEGDVVVWAGRTALEMQQRTYPSFTLKRFGRNGPHFPDYLGDDFSMCDPWTKKAVSPQMASVVFDICGEVVLGKWRLGGTLKKAAKWTIYAIVALWAISAVATSQRGVGRAEGMGMSMDQYLLLEKSQSEIPSFAPQPNSETRPAKTPIVD